MRIDAHHHVWDLSVRDQPWTSGLPVLRRSFALGELEPSLNAHGIDRTVVVQTIGVAEETPELLLLADSSPLVGGVVGWVDLTASDVDSRLAALKSGPGGDHLVGIRHQVQDEEADWLSRDDVRRGLAAVAGAGLAYDLLVRPHQLEAARFTAAALPGLRLVLDHAGKPDIAHHGYDEWALAILDLAQYENVTVKLSGLATEADHRTWDVKDLRPYADHVLDSFGATRVMFGSDWPVCLLAGSYDDIINAAEELTAELSCTQREQVFGDTAARVYGLAS